MLSIHLNIWQSEHDASTGTTVVFGLVLVNEQTGGSQTGAIGYAVDAMILVNVARGANDAAAHGLFSPYPFPYRFFRGKIGLRSAFSSVFVPLMKLRVRIYRLSVLHHHWQRTPRASLLHAF